MCKRTEYLESTDCVKQSLARENAGLDWNYAISKRIDRDLHEKLLPFDSSLLIDFAPVLPLISSGYFHTARGIIEGLTVENEELNEIKEWLLQTLEEADETEGTNAQD